jgi:signal transduction histidine kinase
MAPQTKTSKTEISAKLEHQRLTSLINSMTDAVIALDEHAKVITYNGAALNILDVNTIRKGSRLATLLQPIDANNQPVDIDALVSNTKVPTDTRDLKLKYSDESVINIYLSIAPVHHSYGDAGQNGYVIMLRDITREKSLEEERDEFISVVSHELRTPIAIAEGNLSNAILITDKGGDIAMVKKALAEAHNQVLFLADMINDLSTLSRAERNVLEVTVEPINVASLVEELNSNYKPQAEAKGLSFHSSLDPKLEMLYSSKLYVREILQNFITNSIKYTAKGSVNLKAEPKAKGVLFTVSDTGIGISKSDQERVFDKFFRSEDYRTREAGGTGLGLYITLKLTRLINAELHVESELNKGSTFAIFVPNLQ